MVVHFINELTDFWIILNIPSGQSYNIFTFTKTVSLSVFVDGATASSTKTESETVLLYIEYTVQLIFLNSIFEKE